MVPLPVSVTAQKSVARMLYETFLGRQGRKVYFTLDRGQATERGRKDTSPT